MRRRFCIILSLVFLLNYLMFASPASINAAETDNLNTFAASASTVLAKQTVAPGGIATGSFSIPISRTYEFLIYTDIVCYYGDYIVNVYRVNGNNMTNTNTTWSGDGLKYNCTVMNYCTAGENYVITVKNTSNKTITFTSSSLMIF